MITGAPDIVLESKELALASCGDVGVVVVFAAPDIDMVAEISECMTLLGRRRSGGVGLLLISTKNATPPRDAARAAVGAMFVALRPHLKVMSAYIEGAGFITSAKRSLFTWATSRMTGHTPIKAFASLGETTDWLARSCEERKLSCPSSDELQRLVRRLHPQPQSS